MLDFQQYQQQFTAHIRNPAAHKKPAGVNAVRMATYTNVVFNNIFESVSVCFPVCQAAIGKRVWKQLIRDFVKSYPAQSPIFREIPQQFLQFLNAQTNQSTYLAKPAFLTQLAHYEWVELAVSALKTETFKLSKKTDLLHEKPVLAPAHRLLEYDFAVHKISRRKLPKISEKTYFLVFRNVDFEVKFIELNPITFQLLKLIDQKNMTGELALTALAQAIQHPNAEAMIQFGVEILADLAKQQAIVGSTK
jgi:uncharacterized protein